MKKILIIGENSYLATGLASLIEGFEVSSMNIPEFDKDAELIKSADIIINFAIQPEFSQRILAEDEIIDVKIAELVQNSKTKLFFISSRKVYGSFSSLNVFKETDEAYPFDFYSNNKLLAEKVLQDKLGKNVCILRVSNIVGEPVLRQGYNTFIGWITREFVEKGQLSVNENLSAVKDFVTREYFQKTIAGLLHKDFSGVLNISSGLALPVGQILGMIVGRENIICEGEYPIREQFLLNVEKLAGMVPVLTQEELVDSCRSYHDMLLALREGYLS